MKRSLSGLSLAVVLLAAACSQDKSSPAPVGPGGPENPVAPRSIAFTCDETELSENGSAVVTLRVVPADAQVAPTDFRLADAGTGTAPADFTFHPTGETDPAAGTCRMRIAYKGGERKFQRSVRAVYGDGALQSDPIIVHAPSYTPVVHIRTEAPVVDKENWIAGTLRIDGGNRFEDLPETALSVRGRGNSTWEWEKKPYALKFDKKQEVLGMPKHKRWCLIANYMDRTLLRNRVAHYIASRTSLQWTPRTCFAEVYYRESVNADFEYLGNYLIVEQIKIDENRLNIDELTTLDNEGDALTGGYLLEMDSYYDEMNKFRSVYSDMPVNIKSPDESITDRQFQYIRTYFNEADNLLFDKDYRDPSAMFDITSFMDYWIVNELMGNQEIKHPKSFYVHKPRLGKLTAGPVWEFDYGTLTLADAERRMVRETSMWYARMFQRRAIRRQARERWEALYPFLATVPDYIEAQRDYISDSAHRNLARWPEIKISDAEVQMPNGDELLTFDAAVDRLKASYSMRLAWLDARIRSW